MAEIIDGRAHAAAIKERVRTQVSQMAQPPTLAVVRVGKDPASLVYITGKEKACGETGITFRLYALDEQASQEEVLALIDRLNADDAVDGILVQQPLPPHLDKNAMVSRVDWRKDVDCLHPYNVGLLTAGNAVLPPCTPAGVIELLTGSGITLEGKHCVVLGRSDIVGKPLALMLLQQNATVTVCHSRTRDLPAVTRTADMLVAAVGKPRFVKADMVKEGCALIDVGVNRLEGKKICGDLDYKACFEKASYITRVPGGVGPMTVAMLMENVLRAHTLRTGQSAEATGCSVSRHG